MSAAALQFNAERHEYRLAGRVVPSVTQVIRAVLPGWQASEWHMQRGTALHHGCRLLDQGVLDWSTVSPEIEPRMRAWQRFLVDSGCKVFGIEIPLACSRHYFAGTTDRLLGIETLERGGVTMSEVVCDLKSTIEPQVRIQLGGYSALWSSNGKRVKRAVAVELRDDATYRCLWLDEADLRRAEQTFLATLTVFNFMREHNLREKGKA